MEDKIQYIIQKDSSGKDWNLEVHEEKIKIFHPESKEIILTLTDGSFNSFYIIKEMIEKSTTDALLDFITYRLAKYVEEDNSTDISDPPTGLIFFN